MKSGLTVISLFILLMGCEKIRDYDQRTIFQVEYINYAWGFQHSGIIIDSTGKVMTFNLPSNWHFPDNDGFISLAGMEENISQSEEGSCTADKHDFAENSIKLLDAGDGQLTEPKNEMNDFGVIVYSGFIFDADNLRYKRVIIRQFGDWSIENKSKDANEIYNWLTTICNTGQK